MTRRDFLELGASTVAAVAIPSATSNSGPVFRTANTRWQSTYDKALAVLASNVRTVPRFAGPVLIEGPEYLGIWQECGPHEALVYRRFRPDVARNAHLTFFALQHANGQLPANNKFSETGFGQIQMVVPIAATAWELARATRDSELLDQAYTACANWDRWLLQYRNTRGTGLTEGFCAYDTGHDNSPRWTGIPSQCPGKDARRIPSIPTLPRLCPDLSATTYGSRVALSEMATALGKAAEADHWATSAESIRKLILEKLYVSADAAFYDFDARNQFVRVNSNILSRICGEHIVDQALFDHLWQQQLANPTAYWTRFPLPSIALSDPLYEKDLPRNSWAGPAQALTALRAGRWFDHYNRSAEFTRMMDAWCEALQRESSFRQQMDPVTGIFAPESRPGYSPAALVFIDYTWRLAGIEDSGESLRFNIRPTHPAGRASVFELRTDSGKAAKLEYTAHSASATLNSRPIATLAGGSAALLTSNTGVPQTLLGIDATPQTVRLKRTGHPTASYHLQPNQRTSLDRTQNR